MEAALWMEVALWLGIYLRGWDGEMSNGVRGLKLEARSASASRGKVSYNRAKTKAHSGVEVDDG